MEEAGVGLELEAAGSWAQVREAVACERLEGRSRSRVSSVEKLAGLGSRRPPRTLPLAHQCSAAICAAHALAEADQGTQNS